MIDGRGHITIIDFGLSKQDISTAKGAMSLVGTPDYSAPEVLKTGVYQIEASKARQKEERERQRAAKGKSPSRDASKVKRSASDDAANVGYGKAADWWSLGVMIYEMISGTPAFRGTDLRHTYQRVLFADLEFTPDEKFSAEAKTLLTGLLCRDPSKRLGAEENPPRDIMDAAFFSTISWGSVYGCKTEGPWLPEVPKAERKRITTSEKGSTARTGSGGGGTTSKDSTAKSGKTAVTGPSTGAGNATMASTGGLNRSISVENATPITGLAADADGADGGATELRSQAVPGPLDAIGEESDSQNNSLAHGSGSHSVSLSAPDSAAAVTAKAEEEAPAGATSRNDNDNDISADLEESTDSRSVSMSSEGSHDRSGSSSDQSLEGEITLGRDSIFQHSKHANQNNRLHDWSFFDEGMLLAASQKGKTPSMSERPGGALLGAGAAASLAAVGDDDDGDCGEKRAKKTKKGKSKIKAGKKSSAGTGEGAAAQTDEPGSPGRDSDRERITLTSASH